MWAPGQWNQTGVNAAASQNISPDNVDWALLAQQWIRMKEVHETVVTNIAGPVIGQPLLPMESVSTLQSAQPMAAFNFNASSMTGGEAPMDVEKDESEVTKDSVSWNWPQATQFNWSSNPVCFPFRPELSQQAVFSSVPQHSGVTTQASTIGKNSNITGTLPLLRVPLLPLPQTRLGSSDEDSGGASSSSFHGMPVLDAAKRKNLPAWIREGLEKMEREKQKKEEREKLLHERELKRTSELQPANVLQDPAVVPRSRFDDTEEEDDESEAESAANNVSDFQESNEHIMIKIRQLMTEILLEVTTEEIRSAALEMSQRARVKSRQVQLSLSSISLTQKLGLDQYGSDSDVDSNEASSTSQKLFQIENEKPITGKDESKGWKPMECKGEEDATVDQTYRLSLQRENSRGNVQGKHLPSDTLSKNPMDGSKVDKDISGKLLHGPKTASPASVDEKQSDGLKYVESIKRDCGVGRSSSQSSSGSCDFKSNSRSRLSMKLSPVENKSNEGSGRRSPKQSSRRSSKRSPSCSSFDRTPSKKVDKYRERSRSRHSPSSRKKSNGHSRSVAEDKSKIGGRKLNDRSRSNRSGSHDERKSQRRRSMSRESKSSSKRRSPSRETSRSSRFSRNSVQPRKRRSRSRS